MSDTKGKSFQRCSGWSKRPGNDVICPKIALSCEQEPCGDKSRSLLCLRFFFSPWRVAVVLSSLYHAEQIVFALAIASVCVPALASLSISSRTFPQSKASGVCVWVCVIQCPCLRPA